MSEKPKARGKVLERPAREGESPVVESARLGWDPE